MLKIIAGPGYRLVLTAMMAKLVEMNHKPNESVAAAIFTSSSGKEAGRKLAEINFKASKIDWFTIDEYKSVSEGGIVKDYRYVLVYEAEDIVDFTFIERLRCDVIVGLDEDQCIKDNSALKVFLDKYGSLTKRLAKGGRTTRQVATLAYAIKRLQGDSITNEIVPEREGTIPELVHVTDREEAKYCLISLIDRLLKTYDGMSIGVFFNSEEDLKDYANTLRNMHVNFRMGAENYSYEPGCFLLKANECKGLEFYSVILPEFDVENRYAYCSFMECKGMLTYDNRRTEKSFV